MQALSLRPILLKGIASAPKRLRVLDSFSGHHLHFASRNDGATIFDIPMTYNNRVQYWIRDFQTSQRKWFLRCLERAPRYLPSIKQAMRENKLPQDLAYLALIESGLSTQAVSSASAVGPWQFIQGTARRYGLTINWWLDQRRDPVLSTFAAAHYLKDLYGEFKSWYLVAASYNMGENRIEALIQRFHTHSFWQLARLGVLPDETVNYVPKLLAATLIAKAPALYGFRNIRAEKPLRYSDIWVPGGTDLSNLADSLGLSYGKLQQLNPELVNGFIPSFVGRFKIRVPVRFAGAVARIVDRENTIQTARN